MSLGTNKQAEEIYIVASSSMVSSPGVYLPFTQRTTSNTLFQHPIRQVMMWNLTDGDVMISLDNKPSSSTSAQPADNFVIPSGGYWTDDTATNRQGTSNILNWEKNGTFWARASNLPAAVAPTTGCVTLTICYAYGE